MENGKIYYKYVIRFAEYNTQSRAQKKKRLNGKEKRYLAARMSLVFIKNVP